MVIDKYQIHSRTRIILTYRYCNMNPGAHITVAVTRTYLNSLVPCLITEELENPMIICELIIFIKANAMDFTLHR